MHDSPYATPSQAGRTGRRMGNLTFQTRSQTFPWMLKHWGPPATFWFYAAMCLVTIVFVARFVPETKGKTLEEMGPRGWLA